MSDDGNIVTRDKVEMYLALTAEARIKATPITNNDEDERRLFHPSGAFVWPRCCP